MAPFREPNIDGGGELLDGREVEDDDDDDDGQYQHSSKRRGDAGERGGGVRGVKECVGEAKFSVQKGIVDGEDVGEVIPRESLP